MIRMARLRDRTKHLKTDLETWNVVGDYVQQFLVGAVRLETAPIDAMIGHLAEVRLVTNRMVDE